MSAPPPSKRKAPGADTVFWGESKCSKVTSNGRCTNGAYWKSQGTFLCGVHSRNMKRTALDMNPNAEAAKITQFERWETLVQDAAAANRKAGRKGNVTVAKMRPIKAPDHTDGVRNIFPNNKHQNRKDGHGCCSLSPMRLGPVKHGQPGVPDSLTIENYHQFNKVFERDVYKNANGELVLLREFFTTRDAAYRDPVPHRHKYADEPGVGGNKNVPLFSYHETPSGEGRRYTYLQSRYFYCHQYELLAKQTIDFATLRMWIRNGINLQIVGYDGYPITATPWDHYNDTERPFGHELVLYCLLTIEDPAQYPWNVFYNANRDLYE